MTGWSPNALGRCKTLAWQAEGPQRSGLPTCQVCHNWVPRGEIHDDVTEQMSAADDEGAQSTEAWHPKSLTREEVALWKECKTQDHSSYSLLPCKQSNLSSHTRISLVTLVAIRECLSRILPPLPTHGPSLPPITALAWAAWAPTPPRSSSSSPRPSSP